MKVKINGYRLKFKKVDAPVMLVWLSGLVHTLAAVEKHASACLLSDLDRVLEVEIPAVAYDARDPDLMDTLYAGFSPSDLSALKAARRKVAAAVRLERMP